jgi:hypothetical protein
LEDTQPHLSHIDRYEMAFEYTRGTILQGADCDTDHYLVVAKVRERLAVSKKSNTEV